RENVNELEKAIGLCQCPLSMFPLVMMSTFSVPKMSTFKCSVTEKKRGKAHRFTPHLIRCGVYTD
ncbi:hypothetical protein LR066_00775, partial [candidate division WOR-3 bacterium]|nr:hypothetical protein [candidate division WOR-3 bacterium]